MSIHSAEENNFLLDFVRLQVASRTPAAWSGLNKLTDEDFEWVDGYNVSFTKWLRGAPSDKKDGNCTLVFVDYPPSGYWKNVNCFDIKRHYICSCNCGSKDCSFVWAISRSDFNSCLSSGCSYVQSIVAVSKWLWSRNTRLCEFETFDSCVKHYCITINVRFLWRAVPFVNSCEFYLTVSIILLYIYFMYLFYYFFIHFLGDISISFAILNSRWNKGLLLLLFVDRWIYMVQVTCGLINFGYERQV